jgi:hypothetical protein
MLACMHTYMNYRSLPTCMHACMHIDTYEHADIYILHARSLMHTYIHTHTYIRTYIHAYMHADIYIHAFMGSYTHTYAHKTERNHGSDSAA